MIAINVPGLADMRLNYLVLDFNGTLAADGKLIRGTATRLNAISRRLELHVVTADTFGSASAQLSNIRCALHIVKGAHQDVQKERMVRKLGPEHTVCIGNGRNDMRMLKASRLGICVVGSEGASASAMSAADICVTGITDALEMLLKTERVKATLRLS